MSDDLHDRIRDLLTRAGLGAVSPKAFACIALMAVAIVALGFWRWTGTGDGGERFEIDSSAVAAAPKQAAGVAKSVEPTSVVVHVVGAVRHPGVVSISAGSRVSDALFAAGGLLPNAAQQALNLARVVADGEQIVVPTLDEWQASGSGVGGAGGGAAGGAAPGGVGAAGVGGTTAAVNINTATAQQLEELPGIGPSTAAKIIADREANGPFTTPEDLMRVSGIGEKKFEALGDAVAVQ